MTDLPLNLPPTSICIMRLSAIGDICHTLPVVRTLQAQWPQTRITWIIGKLEATLVGDIPDIEFIVYNKSEGSQAARQLRQKLADRRFDVLLHMQASLRASRLIRHINADIKLGFDRDRARDWQWLFTTHRIAANPRSHVIDGLFGFAEALGINERVMRWDIPISAADKAFASQHITESNGALIISPCSSQRARNFRNWRSEYYARVIDHAHKQHGLQAILTGGPTELEREYGRAIAEQSKADVTNLIGQTNLKQLFALINRSAAVLAPDSGPIHMATAAGTPAIGLFASSNPLRTGPLDQRWLVNRYPEALKEDCGKTIEQARWGQRVRDPKVMDRIMPDEVCARIDDMAAHVQLPHAQRAAKDQT